MNKIAKVMKELPDFFGLSGASEEQIASAERELQTHFASDYREYLAAYGIASANGHELTGLCSSRRLNVVEVTKTMAAQYSGVPSDWYVIEQANIDGIVVWQSPDGSVYQTQIGADSVLISNGLLEYIK